jgi:L-2-hydroxyglutarate oxidase LhgO
MPAQVAAQAGVGGAVPFQHLIYPVPEPGGLGVHYTLDLAGHAKFGPDVEWVEDVEYSVSIQLLELQCLISRIKGSREVLAAPSYCQRIANILPMYCQRSRAALAAPSYCQDSPPPLGMQHASCSLV